MRQDARLLRVVPAAVLGVATAIAACGGESPGAMSPAEARESGARALRPGCEAWTGQPIEAACVPRTAREGVPLVFEAVATCGACGAHADTCSVTREARTLVLSLDGQNCAPPPGAACESACTQQRLSCRIPALEGGRYVIRSNDPGGREDTLDVVPDGSARTQCLLE